MKDMLKKEKINLILTEIINILKNEEESNWLRAFENMKQEVSILEKNQTSEEAIFHVKDIFESIYKGNGSFSDFSIWRDNAEERIRLNREFEKKIHKLVELINN